VRLAPEQDTFTWPDEALVVLDPDDLGAEHQEELKEDQNCTLSMHRIPTSSSSGGGGGESSRSLLALSLSRSRARFFDCDCECGRD
jgi:hypothetical protein